MSRLTLAAIKRSNLCCHDCNKRLNKRTVEYRKHVFPMGTVELVPICCDCKEGSEDVKS